MSPTASICVTHHALQRYRERIAAYGDAPAREVVESIRRSRPARDEEMPFKARRVGSIYRVDDASGAFYVLNPAEGVGESWKVVTVVDMNKPLVQPLNPKKRSDR